MASSGNRNGSGFHVFAMQAANWVGTKWAFMIALLVIVLWLASGPYFHYSDTWQLIINTGTTVVTFLVVFLIQNTQNRDILTVQLKLSELVLAMKGAEDKFASIEDLSDDELEELHVQCRTQAEMAMTRLQSRRGTTGGGDDAETGRKNPKPRAVAHSAKTQKKRSRAADKT
jgi:low affinity Fe/Cu permease